MTKMEDDKMEDDQNGRRPKWKTTKIEAVQNEADQSGRRPKWKTTKSNQIKYELITKAAKQAEV